MAQPTQWASPILDYVKKVKSSTSTVVLAPNSSSDSFLVVNCIFLYHFLVYSDVNTFFVIAVVLRTSSCIA